MNATSGWLRLETTRWPSRLVACRDAAIAWAGAEQSQFILWLPVLFGAGIGAYFAAPAEPGPGIILALAGLLAGLGILLWSQPFGRLGAIAMAGLLAGFAAASFATWRAAPMPVLPRHAIMLTGTIARIDPLPKGARLTLSAAHWPGHARLLRTVRVHLQPRHDPGGLLPGDVVRLRAMLRPPPPPAFPGGYDPQRAAFFTGRAGGGWSLGPAILLAHAPPTSWAVRWSAWRQHLARRIMDDLPGARGTVAADLLTGEGAAIPRSDRDAFRDAGLAHLLAVAGLHIAAVMGTFFAALRFLFALSERASLRLPCKQIAAGGALAAGLFYLLLTGAHLPTERSFAMATLATLGLLAGRRVLSLRGLALAAMLILAAEPQVLSGVSFQMSFAAVMALIAGYHWLRPALAHIGARWQRHLVALLLTSLLAGLASAPFAAAQFGQVQIWFVLANLLAVPVTALFIMPLGIAALLLMPLGLQWLALAPMGQGIGLVLWLARGVASLPAATLPVPQTPDWGLAATALGLCFLCLWRTRLRLAGLPLLVLGLASPALLTPPNLMVSANRHMVALRGADMVQMLGHRGSTYTRTAWMQAWGIRRWRIIHHPPAMPTAPAGQGAAALWETHQGMVWVTDRELRGTRPWVLPEPGWFHVVPDLPMALAEKLPPRA